MSEYRIVRTEVLEVGAWKYIGFGEYVRTLRVADTMECPTPETMVRYQRVVVHRTITEKCF